METPWEACVYVCGSAVSPQIPSGRLEPLPCHLHCPQGWSLPTRTHSGCVLSNCWTNAHGSLSPSVFLCQTGVTVLLMAGGPSELSAGKFSLKTLHSPSPTSCSSLPQAFSLSHRERCTNLGELIVCISANSAFSNIIVIEISNRESIWLWKLARVQPGRFPFRDVKHLLPPGENGSSREQHGGVITPIVSGITCVHSPALSLTNCVIWFSYLTSLSLIHPEDNSLLH